MQIKTILTEQIDFTMEQVERYLCINQISYVRVENEIHCPGLILRFFDFEKEKIEIRAGLLARWEKEQKQYKKELIEPLLEYENNKGTPWYIPKQNKRKLLKMNNQKPKKYI